MGNTILGLEKLCSTYKTKWVEKFGNVSNKYLEEMWRDIFMTNLDVIKRNSLRRRGIIDVTEEFKKPLNVVFSSTMGTGKSTTQQHFLLHGLDTMFYKALVVVELKNTADEYQKILKSKGAVAVHSGTEINPKKELEDNLDAPILIITHEKLTRLLNKNKADEVFNQYDLVVIDEQISTYQHMQLDFKYLMDTVYTPLMYTNLYEGLVEEVVSKLINSLHLLKNTIKTDETYVVNKYTKDISNIADWIEVAKEVDALVNDRTNELEAIQRKRLRSFSILCKNISKQGRMKVVYYQKKGNRVSFNVVVDFMPIHISKVLFDGTASINDTYKFLNEYIGKDTVEIKEYHKHLRSFKNATIKYYKMSTGKSSLTVDPDKQSKSEYDKAKEKVKLSLKELVDNTIERYGKEERVLFIIHKLNKPYLEPLLKYTNYTYTWWGAHVGSNIWSEYNKVVVWGLNHLPENTYTAKYFSTYSANTDINLAPINDMKIGLLTVDILQAIFRGGLRVTSDDYGNCSSECEVVIGLENNKAKIQSIIKRMQVVLHDAKYVPIKDGAVPINLKSKNKEKMYKLISKLEEKKGESSYRDKTNKKALGGKPPFLLSSNNIGYCNPDLRELLIRGSNTERNISLLAKHNWVYNKATQEDKEVLGIKGKAPYVFKYIGKFEDEVPRLGNGLDINGNEF